MKNITAIALGEEVEKKIPNKERLSEHDETSIKFLKEAIKFHFNPPSGHFIFIAGKADWEYYFSGGGGNNITCKCVRKPSLMYLWNKGTFGFSSITLSLFLADVVIKAFRSN